MRAEDFQIHDTEKLDHLMAGLIEMILGAHQYDPEGFGRVAAGVLDNDNRFVPALNYLDDKTGKRVHAERAAIDQYMEMHGEIPSGSIVITTLSPCTDEHSEERFGESCDHMISLGPVHKVYCGYIDPTQEQNPNKTYHLKCTENQKLKQLCKMVADTFLK